jgi:hypothetical protein
VNNRVTFSVLIPCEPFFKISRDWQYRNPIDGLQLRVLKGSTNKIR